MLPRLFDRPISLPWLLLVMSAVPLLLALISQFAFGLHPCELCIWQRYPYGVLITLSLLALLWRKRRLGGMMVAFIVLWLLEAALALYHVGVEQGWWASVTGCSAAGEGGLTLDELRAQIMGGPLVACDQPEWVLLGLSMAGWNLLYSLGAALCCAYIFLKMTQRSHA